MSNLKKHHFLYKTTNLINGKYYIGIHTTSNLKDGYLGSGKYLKLAIQKYGHENFKCEILEWCENRDELLKREEELVTEDFIKDELCMNLRQGGSGGWTSEQQRCNAIKSNFKQRWLWENDEEWSKRRRDKQSVSNKMGYESGTRIRKVFCDWTGKKHREDTKKKIGEINSIKQKGERNSQFGTCWITNGTIDKKIMKYDLHLFEGWSMGRSYWKMNKIK